MYVSNTKWKYLGTITNKQLQSVLRVRARARKQATESAMDNTKTQVFPTKPEMTKVYITGRGYKEAFYLTGLSAEDTAAKIKEQFGWTEETHRPVRRRRNSQPSELAEVA